MFNFVRKNQGNTSVLEMSAGEIGRDCAESRADDFHHGLLASSLSFPGHNGSLMFCRSFTVAIFVLWMVGVLAGPSTVFAFDAEAADRPSTMQDETQADARADNVLYFELLGSAGLASINYERMLGSEWALRIGVGWTSAVGGSDRSLVVMMGLPIMMEYLGLATGGNHLELGLGFTPTLTLGEQQVPGFNLEEVAPVLIAVVIGYRYQPANGGFMMRVGFTPIFSPGGFGLRAWPGLSLGASF